MTTPPKNAPQFREGTSPIDREELARLLPAGLDGFGPTAARGDGNSPPMDQDAWMAQMMGNLYANNPNQPPGAPGHPGGVPPHYGQMPPMGGPPPGFDYYGRGGRGGRGFRGGRGRGRGRGGYNPSANTAFFNSLAAAGGQRPDPANASGSGSGAPPSVALRSGYAIVEFKRERVKKYQCPANIPTGEYVIVDGDRGQDCGLVVQVLTVGADSKVEISSLDGTDVDGTKLKIEPGRVLRIASEVEISMLHNEIAALERAALKTCRARCQEMGFGFEIIDCEYQFDRKKISFFFDSEHSIDFRDLVKDLYKMFGARIWMENINPGVKNVVPQGALSRHEKAALSRAATSRGGGDVSVSARPFYPRARQPPEAPPQATAEVAEGS